MKILIQSTNGGAHQYINLGLARAFEAIGYETYLWTDQNQSPFDIFDQTTPDIFLGQTYNLNNSLIKCIQERPQLKVGLRASDRSNFASEVEKKYPILVANQKEIELVNLLRDKTGKPTFLHNHYIQKSIEKTHEDWIKDDYNVISLLNASDLFDFYGGQYKEEFASDLCFIGGYLPLKSPSINRNLMPILNTNMNIKIFGNSSWPCSQYMGYIPDNQAKNVLASSKICLNLTEEHGIEYGYDINERYMKLLSNKCLCISDYVIDAIELFPSIIHCKNPNDFRDQIQYWVMKDFNDPERIQKINEGFINIMNHHTYFDRAKTILNQFNITSEVQSIKDKICR